MPHGKQVRQHNFVAVYSGLGLRPENVYFIVNEGYGFRGLKNEEEHFSNSLFCGSKKSCEEHLNEYPNCKII